MLANKAFKFTPEYTLWGISWPMLSSMFTEFSHYNEEQFGSKEEETSAGNLAGIKGVKIKKS